MRRDALVFIKIYLLLFFFVAYLYVFFGDSVAAEVQHGSFDVNEGEYDKGTFIYLENDFYRLEFDLSRGGRCRNFIIKDDNQSLNSKVRNSGFFLDHWGKYGWPSGLFEKPYQYEIIGDGVRSQSIRLCRIDDGNGADQGQIRYTNDSSLCGLKMLKTITLYSDKRYIDVEQEVINPNSEARGVSVYLQHAFILAGSQLYDRYSFPTKSGISTLRTIDLKRGAKGKDWIYEPVAGWIGACDEKTGDGLVFLFDYNYLDKMYSCGVTAEWWYENVIVPSGKGWKTNYKIIPTRGFDKGFVHASHRLLAHIQRDKAGSMLAFTVAGATEALGDITLKIKVIGFNSKQTIKTYEMVLEDVKNEGVTGQMVLEKPLPEDSVVYVTASGQGWQETYEHYVLQPGSLVEKQEEMGMAPLGGQSSSAEAYSIEVPAKIKTYTKPDFSTISVRPSDSQKVLLLFGLYTNHYHIEEALKTIEMDVKVSNAPPTGVAYFPATYEKLFGYHTVILSNINAKAVGSMGLEMLYDYVQHGGNIVVLGGNYSMGNGDFPANSRFQQFLPVELIGPFDMRWAGKKQAWAVEVVLPESPLLTNVSFDEKPMAFWVHEVKPKANTEVILKAGPYPALIAGSFGKGKVVVCTMTCMGNPEPGQQEFWESEMWKTIIQNIIQNL